MKRFLKYPFYFILFPLLIILFYVLIAYLFTLFPKKTTENLERTKTIYLLYSVMHSDIVFNIQDLNLSHFSNFEKKKTGYLAFGWGDKETYLNTPNIKDIKISTSLKALFINTPSLMHLSYLRDISRYRDVKEIKLSTQEFEALKQNIFKSFHFKEKIYKGYNRNDVFYTANGQYNLINTCNTWTGERLREVNVTVAYWTPLSQTLLRAIP